MFWMSWRQFRAQAAVAAVALLVAAVYLLILGTQIRHTYHGDLARCHDDCVGALQDFQHVYQTRVYVLDGILVILPALLGAFWGAPLVARELEAGTHRLVWNQTVTRRRWLTIKLLSGVLAGATVTGTLSALLTWAASPFDQVAGDRFSALLFGTRNLAPVAYAVFAFTLGAVLGLTIRRTVPTMALTILVFTIVQFVVPSQLRPQFQAPVTTTRPMTADTLASLTFLGADASIRGLQIPGAWVTSTSRMLTPTGQPVDQAQYNACLAACLPSLKLHVTVAYQPGTRYWTFQWLESTLYLCVSLLLAAFGLWRIQRRPT